MRLSETSSEQVVIRVFLEENDLDINVSQIPIFDPKAPTSPSSSSTKRNESKFAGQITADEALILREKYKDRFFRKERVNVTPSMVDEWKFEIEYEELKIQKKLGQGQYGKELNAS